MKIVTSPSHFCHQAMLRVAPALGIESLNKIGRTLSMSQSKKVQKLIPSILLAIFLLASQSPVFAEAVDPKLADYKSVSGISGNLNSIGSDTLNNLMTYWSEAFKALYPNVRIQIEGKGSSTAAPALIAGTAQLGPMSRPMKATEIDAFEKKFGYKPTEIRVAIDALALYVHKDNPIEGLTLAQIDGIFSSTRKRGNVAINNWGELGLSGNWKNKPISLYGRNSASGTYGYFKEEALKKGDFKNSVKEQPGSSAVVQSISSDLAALGYSGIGYKTSGVKILKVGESLETLYAPTLENSLSKKYPLSRFLYIYINKKPGAPLDPLTREFLKFVESKQGQNIVVKDGYFPLTSQIIQSNQSL